MKVRLGQFIGVDGENGVVIVVQLHRRLRPRVQHLRDMGPHRVRQKGCVQVFVFLEVVNGRAVEQNGGAVHGQTLPHSVEGGQRTACGDGKRAALSHEILDGFPVFRQQLRHGLQSLQSVFRVRELTRETICQIYPKYYPAVHSPLQLPEFPELHQPEILHEP